MINKVSFRKVNDPFLNTVTEGIKKVNTSKNVFVFADKTQNIYEVPPSTYTKLLTENITKTYKTENEDITEKTNKELKELTNKFGIGNRIDIMAKREAFVTLKDHKENIDSHRKCRLINPVKSELGKVRKVILDAINNNIN
jgi:hypothetical protein